MSEQLNVVVQGKKRDVPFTLEEYLERRKKVKKVMEREKLDMIYATQPDSIFYLTGFRTAWYRAHSGKPWMDMSAGGVAIHLNHEDLICYENPAEEDMLWMESIATDVRIFADDGRWMYGRQYFGVTKDKNFIDCVTEDLQKSGWASNCTVGLEMGGHRPSPAVTAKIIASLEAKGCKVVDATEIIREVRALKSPKEVEYTIKAGEYMNKAVEALKKEVRPGMTELQVSAIYEAALRNAGSENAGIVNMCRTGYDIMYSLHHLAGRDRVIEKGVPFCIDFSGVHNRYHCNNCRVFCIDEPVLPDSPIKNIIECLRKTYPVKDFMKEILKPNMPVAELMEPVKDYYVDLGVWGQQFWTGGYEIGIAFPPDWCGTLVYGPKEFHHHADEFADARFTPGTVINFEQGFLPIDTIVFSETEARIMGESTWDVIVI